LVPTQVKLLWAYANENLKFPSYTQVKEKKMQAAKKVALITGANKGIGFEAARQIARAGWTVLAAARNEELGRKAAATLQAEGLDVHFIAVDLDAHETAASAAESIREQFGKLDLLINNAAIAGAGDGPPRKVKLEAVEAVMRTNYLGTVAVTQAMLPLLQLAGEAQIINVSSELGSVSLHNDPDWKYAPVKLLAYCASKAALNMFTVQLAYEFRDGGIAVNSVNPGYTATDLNENRGTQTVKEGAAEIVRVALLEPHVTGKFLETGGEIAW
jgi:NAD(P)-dependent dehydrogenase (short-subunit alcohol dehydrogenase family)